MAERRVRLVAEPLAQRPDHARLANPWLAREQHPLAIAVFGPGPALEQDAEPVLAPDQGREMLAVQGFEVAFARPSPSTRQAATGFLKPLRRSGPRSASSN